MTKAITPQLPKPTENHQQFGAFIGKWHAEGSSYADGQQAADPLASAVPWTSDETYEWLPGEFFVLHRWDAMAGDRVFKGTQILGFDGKEGGYFTRHFDNTGNHPEYHAKVSGNIWTFTGDATRATVTITEGGNQMRFNWEWLNQGEKWLPLCDRTARRVAIVAKSWFAIRMNPTSCLGGKSMPLKLLRFVTVLLVALLAGLAFAHVLEQSAKMAYDAALYITIQKSLYVQWGPPNVGGFLEPSAIVATALFAFFIRKSRRDLWLTLSALLECCWRFRSFSFGWLHPQTLAFLLPRYRASHPIGQNCVQTGKWAMPFVSDSSWWRSVRLSYHGYST